MVADNDELNNQGDYISGAIGEDGKSILVGKNLTQQNREIDNSQRSDNRVNINMPNLGGRDPTVADIYDIVAFNRYTGEPGLVGKVNAIDKRLNTVENKVVGIDNRLIDIDKLIKERNVENRGKIHVSYRQAIVLIFLLIVIIGFVLPWLQQVAGGGVLDGRFGFTLPLRSYGRLLFVADWWFRAVETTTCYAGFCSGLGDDGHAAELTGYFFGW